MAGYLNFNDAIEEIKSRANIVDVIGRDVQLKRSGANFKGLCPFHGEKTPSFTVSEQKQLFTCFGCGASGDVIRYVQRRDNLDFNGALKKLADEYGVELREESWRGGVDRKLLFEINREAAIFFYKAMRAKKNPALDYLRGRGLSDETMRTFGLGYADGSWDSLYRYMKSKGYEDSKLLNLGLVSKSDRGEIYDKFRDRAIFPIINTQGNIIGFGGRALGDFEPKYLNSAESQVFQKKNNLYALNLSHGAISSEGRAVLVEGYMDVIALYQAGIRNVSASLGTALTENQARLLKRYTKNVVLSYDADKAGRAAALRGIDILQREDIRVRVLHVTDGKDPDEFIKKNGREAFLRLMDEEALPAVEYKLNNIREKHDMEREEERLEYVHEAAAMLAGLSPSEAELYSERVAENAGFSKRAVQREIESKALSAEPEKGYYERRTETRSHRKRDDNELSKRERVLIFLCIRNGRRFDELGDVWEAISGRRAEAILKKLEGIYREKGDLSDEILKESLDVEESEIIKDILEKTGVSIEESKLFAECKNGLKIQLLKDKEKMVLERIEILESSEEEDREALTGLFDELKAVQTELRATGTQRGGNA